MQTGFGKRKYFNFKQKFIWMRFWGVTNEFRIGSENGIEPTKKQAINSLAPGKSECYCKNAFFNIDSLIGNFGFS